METDDLTRTGLERILHESHGPRSYMEQLYYKGITGTNFNHNPNYDSNPISDLTLPLAWL